VPSQKHWAFSLPSLELHWFQRQAEAPIEVDKRKPNRSQKDVRAYEGSY
jgi:hypothetical protein